MTTTEAIGIVLEELETNSLEVRPLNFGEWEEALRALKREIKREEKRRRKVRQPKASRRQARYGVPMEDF